jgi:aspartate kinase
MHVMKFGGTVLRTPEGFRRMAQLLRRDATRPTLVVVSAFATATRDLEFAARLALAGNPSAAHERLDHLMDDHRALVQATVPHADAREALAALLDEARTEIAALFDGVAITGQLTPRTLDAILAYGEFLALHVAKHALAAEGLDVTSLDVRRVLVTDERFGAATPLIERTRLRVEHDLRPLFHDHDVVLVQGFVGRSESGATTTMGKESSNLTAAVLGAVLGATEIVIWTNVAGIRSGDPDVCDHTLARPSMSYAEARIAADNGVKLLYPTMIEPAEHAGITIRIAGTDPDQHDVTTIAASGGPCDPIVVIRDIDDTKATLSCVFAPGAAWLHAVANVVDRLGIDGAFDVERHESSRVAHLTIPRAKARVATVLLHELLTTP